MQAALRLETTVLPGHRLEISAPELPEGAKVEVIVVLSAKSETQDPGSPPDPGPGSQSGAVDPILTDWNVYYQLLGSGQLDAYRGKFVVVSQGKVVASGEDPHPLRSQLAEQLKVPAEQLVIPFVDDKEDLTAP